MPIKASGDEEAGSINSVPAGTEGAIPQTRQQLQPMRRNKEPSRLTVVERVYHQPAGQEAVAFESPFYRFLASEDTCYNRSLTVTPEWQQIDLAWVAKPAMLYLANEGRTQVGPDVVVGVEVPHGLDPMPVARIPAGESMRLCPIAGATFYAICPLGSGRLKVVAIPE